MVAELFEAHFRMWLITFCPVSINACFLSRLSTRYDCSECYATGLRKTRAREASKLSCQQMITGPDISTVSLNGTDDDDDESFHVLSLSFVGSVWGRSFRD